MSTQLIGDVKAGKQSRIKARTEQAYQTCVSYLLISGSTCSIPEYKQYFSLSFPHMIEEHQTEKNQYLCQYSQRLVSVLIL